MSCRSFARPDAAGSIQRERFPTGRSTTQPHDSVNQTGPLTLDTDRLGPYLAARMTGFEGLRSTEKFSGGQSNPTFRIKAASGEYVLRQKPPGTLLPSAHAVDREYRVLKALVDTEVPVARPYLLCEDEAVIGSMFYVMSYVPGRILWKPTLPGLSRAERATSFDDMIRVLALLHSIDIDAVGLSDFGRAGNYFERQIHRWSRQYRASETESIDAMERLIAELPSSVPPNDSQVCLIHGDYRLDNLIFHPQQAQILAVIDWELSTLGHAMADLAYFCMCLRMHPSEHIAGLGGVDRTALGIPKESAMVTRYCELRGIESIDHWPFYLTFSFFRLAAICQGVLKRSLDGTASNPNAARVGGMARTLAEMAVVVLDETG